MSTLDKVQDIEAPEAVPTFTEQPKKRRGRPPKAKPVMQSQMREPLEKKLDHFQYTKDEDALELWEHGTDVNPLKLPKDIKNNYPHMRFRWVSKRTWDKRGKNYQGWQEFMDKGHPKGLQRGNDLFLCAIPEEIAQKRENYFRQQSRERIQDMQRNAAEMINQIEAAGHEAIGEPGQIAAGLVVGTRPKVGKGGGYNRGLQQEVVAEIIAKNREKRARGRVYIDLGKR